MARAKSWSGTRGNEEVPGADRQANAALSGNTVSIGSVVRHSFTYGELAIDLDEQSVQVAGRAIELTKIQYLLLTHLLRRAGQVVTADELRARCLRTRFSSETGVRNHVFKLRSRLGMAGRLVRSVRGVGYSFTVEDPCVSKK